MQFGLSKTFAKPMTASTSRFIDESGWWAVYVYDWGRVKTGLESTGEEVGFCTGLFLAMEKNGET